MRQCKITTKCFTSPLYFKYKNGFFSRQHNGVCIFQTRVSGFHFSLDRPEALCFVDFEVESPCFFLDAAGSTNGPDQVWIGAFPYEKFELKGTSGGSKDASMCICCDEPNGYPSVPSWCGGGNFSLLLFAFACVINRRLCQNIRKTRWHKTEVDISTYVLINGPIWTLFYLKQNERVQII